jgi:hypothetical protein
MPFLLFRFYKEGIKAAVADVEGYTNLSATRRQALATLVWPLLTTVHGFAPGNKGCCGAILQNIVA